MQLFCNRIACTASPAATTDSGDFSSSGRQTDGGASLRVATWGGVGSQARRWTDSVGSRAARRLQTGAGVGHDRRQPEAAGNFIFGGRRLQVFIIVGWRSCGYPRLSSCMDGQKQVKAGLGLALPHVARAATVLRFARDWAAPRNGRALCRASSATAMRYTRAGRLQAHVIHGPHPQPPSSWAAFPRKLIPRN